MTKDGEVLRNIEKKPAIVNIMGADALVASVKRYAIGLKLQKLVNIIVWQCQRWGKNNPEIQKRPPSGEVKQGQTPGEYWQIDFSELPNCNQVSFDFGRYFS